MFVIESVAGVLAQSTALLSDSMDMLGDALVYGFSLYVVSRDAGWQARAALLKGLLMAGFAAGVLAQAGFKIVHGLAPSVEVMGTVGAPRARRQSPLPRSLAEAPRRRHQHALGLGVLAQRRDRQRAVLLAAAAVAAPARRGPTSSSASPSRGSSPARPPGSSTRPRVTIARTAERLAQVRHPRLRSIGILAENRRAPGGNRPHSPGGLDAQAAILREDRLRFPFLQPGRQGQRARHDPLHLGPDRPGRARAVSSAEATSRRRPGRRSRT